MPTYVLKFGDDLLTRYGNALGSLSDHDARKVMARGLNRAGGPTLTAVRRALAKQTSAPMSVIRRQVVGRKAWAGEAGGEGRMEYVIKATGRPLPLHYFHPKEFSFGVRAKVWGRFQRFEGAFMYGGPWPNRVMGSWNAFGNVFHRDGRARLPIDKMYGPALPTELVTDQSKAAFEANASRLGPALAHELERVLPSR